MCCLSLKVGLSRTLRTRFRTPALVDLHFPLTIISPCRQHVAEIARYHRPEHRPRAHTPQRALSQRLPSSLAYARGTSE